MEKMVEGSQGISRRLFLTGAGVGALGLALAGTTGCAPASTETTNQTEESNSAAAVEQNDSGEITVSETIETDVLVVGAGCAGLTAAISAAEEGAKVIVIDQLPGLQTTYAHSITAIGTKYQQELGEDWTAEELVDFWNQYPDSDYYMNRDAQLFAAEHSAESIEWLESHGVDIVGVTNAPTNPFQYPRRTFVTSANRDGVKAYLEPLKATAETAGVEFRFSTEVRSLVVGDDGSVAGAIAASEGTGIEFKAQAVIIAAGGFGGSSDMMRLYAPKAPCSAGFDTPVKGDGAMKGLAFSLAGSVNAQIVAPGGSMLYFENIDGAFTDNPGVGAFINHDGKRWVNENLYFLDRAGIAYKEGVSEYWAVYDAPLYETYAAAAGETSLANGTTLKADSLEELASLMGVPVKTFTDTIATYNKASETGVDEEFGKPKTRTGRVADPDTKLEYYLEVVDKEFTLINPVATPPFYAIHMTPQKTGLSGTSGGVLTNTDGQVLDNNGEVISGLYAIGESANGHLIGYFYPQSGTSLCMCFCFGRYAGMSAAKTVSA